MAMIEPKSIEEFRDAGMLYVANTILQFFGWSLVCMRNDNTEKWSMYPARTKFRGFSDMIDAIGHKRVADYLLANVEALRNEAYSEEDE